jgi:hypothetical protein
LRKQKRRRTILLPRGFLTRQNNRKKGCARVGWKKEERERSMATTGSNKRMQRRPRSEFLIVL